MPEETESEQCASNEVDECIEVKSEDIQVSAIKENPEISNEADEKEEGECNQSDSDDLLVPVNRRVLLNKTQRCYIVLEDIGPLLRKYVKKPKFKMKRRSKHRKRIIEVPESSDSDDAEPRPTPIPVSSSPDPPKPPEPKLDSPPLANCHQSPPSPTCHQSSLPSPSASQSQQVSVGNEPITPEPMKDLNEREEKPEPIFPTAVQPIVPEDLEPILISSSDENDGNDEGNGEDENNNTNDDEVVFEISSDSDDN